MKYLITESQYKLISELERTWRNVEYAEQYKKLKHRLVPYFEKLVDSYDENDFDIYLFDSDNKILVSYIKKSGELYYSRHLDKLYEEVFPHPIWLVHSDFILSDVFNIYFPDYEVKSVKSVIFS
jgi:hypothetical protein